MHGVFSINLKNWVRFQAKRHIMDMQRSGNANWRQKSLMVVVQSPTCMIPRECEEELWENRPEN